MLYYIAKYTCLVLLSCWYSLRFEGQENIPQTGGCILICNHLSFIDPILLAFGTRRKLSFLGKAELFKNGFLNWFFRQLCVMPVERGKGDMAALQNAIDVVERGGILGIFPEGTRSLSGEPLRPKSGAAHIANRAQADILPAAITFTRGRRFRSRVIIRFGQVVPYGELGFAQGTPSELRGAVKIMFDAVLNLYRA